MSQRNEIMSDMKVCLVRPPALPAYQDTDIKEDPMLTSFLGYLFAIGFKKDNIAVYDYQLDRTITYEDLTKIKFDHYIIAARDLGESYRYSIRVSEKLSIDTTAKIWLYGQVAPLRYLKSLPSRVALVNQDEKELAKALGLKSNGPEFTKNLQCQPYFDYLNLDEWQKNRKKGAIETTRGCPYKCKFCFISAGKNYAKRWQVRPIDCIINDLKNYIEDGIRSFVFLDSEFLGANSAYHEQKEFFLHRIIEELPEIEYMSLCRADTLLMFDKFGLLKQSGLKKVLVGVESLYQPDLDALKKDSTVEKMMEAISQLISNEIECCLTFLTFHRNTTLQGLRENLNNVQKLYSHPNARYLGMPNFSFNMEVVRGEYSQENMQDLSNVTYIKPLLEARSQPNTQVCFPVFLEPLIEIYRLLQYEWVVKKCELIHAKQKASKLTIEKINNWFSGLGQFCVTIMLDYLGKFENNELTFNTLEKEKENLFISFRNYYSNLPSELRGLATYDTHAREIDYKQHLEIEDHGWDKVFSSPSNALYENS